MHHGAPSLLDFQVTLSSLRPHKLLTGSLAHCLFELSLGFLHRPLLQKVK